MSAPRSARVRLELDMAPLGGAPERLLTDHQVWAAQEAERSWLLAADVVTVRRSESTSPASVLPPGAESSAPFARWAPACRVFAEGGPRPAIRVDGGDLLLPARSAWDARVLGAVAHSWLAVGLDMGDLALVWAERAITGFRAAAGRRSVDVSLRLGAHRACCRWTMLR